MSEKLKPNFTQVPNVILDEAMRGLPDGAFKLLMAICRLTYGYGKQSDRISLSQLADLTGMDRRSVARARKRLGPLLEVNPGSPTRASEYHLNIGILDAELEAIQRRLSDRSVTTDREVTSDRGSDHRVPFQRKPKKEDIALTTKASLLRVASNQNGHWGEKNAPFASPTTPGHNEAMELFHDLFLARFGAKPDIVGGRDGKILSELIKSHCADEVIELLRYFFEHPPAWIEKNSKFTIPAFKHIYTELLAQSRNGKCQMGVLNG